MTSAAKLPHLLCLLTACASWPALAGETWSLDASARGIGAFELEDGAPNGRHGVFPVASLKAARLVDPWFGYAHLRLGLPIYGQQAFGLGAGIESVVSESRVDADLLLPAARTLRVLLYAAVEGGVSLSYIAAPPEVQYYPDAAMYWGPYARVELGTRVLLVDSATTPIGLVLSTGVDLTAARYIHPSHGRGLRLGVDVGLGGELRF